MKRPILFWLVACGIFSRAAAAEMSQAETARDYLVQIWQTDKGLPQNWVSSIAQTPDGYLWIGTRYGGLARFDGVRFVSFNQQNTEALKDVQVEHLSVDATGRLWVSMGNESITGFQNGQFELFRKPRSDPRVRVDHVLSVRSNEVLFAGEMPYLATINFAASNRWDSYDPRPSINPDPRTFLLDQDGVVWFVTTDRQLVSFSSNRFSMVTNGPPEKAVTSVAVDATRQLWISTPRHLALWNGKSFLDRTPANGTLPDSILQISFDGDGGLWVLEKNRLRKCFNGQWTVEIMSEELLSSITSGTFSLHGDSSGNAWLVANGRGLLHCKSDGSAHLLTERSGLPSRFITCWFQDAEGGIWIGMHGGGIAHIRERLFHVFGQAEGLPDKVVSSVCADARGGLWAGTMSGGLARWQNNKFENIPLVAPESDPDESITVCPAAGNGVWVGSLNHGVLLYRDGKFTSPSTPWSSTRILFADSRKQLWVGGLVNLFCLTNGGYKEFGPGDGFADSHAIGAMAEDAAGTIWIGTGPGQLWKYAAGKFTRYDPPPEWPAVRFSAVLPDTNGAVWIGTLGGGLLRFSDGKFTRCLKSNGLPDNNVPQLLDSRDGFLWGGTYAGIFRASKSELENVAAGKTARLSCRVYGQFDGLPALECSSGFQPSCWRTDDGHLWFSTANGVASVDPVKTVPNRVPPTVIIEEMLVDGRRLDFPPRIGAPLQAGNSPAPVEIPPGRHYVQFRFTGLSFAAPDGVRFRVKLEGGDGTWQSTGGQRQIGYGPLLPGDYHFRVIAGNSDDVWNDEGDTLAFTVLPHFWETWWFQVGMGILTLALFAAGAALIQRQRYRRRLERAERQREMEHERSRIAQDLHDDLGTSLTQISFLSALANRDKTPAGETKELIQQVRNRAREMLIALDEIVWAVNPKNDSLGGLASYLGHFAEEFYRPTGIRFRLEIPPQLPPVPLSAESRHHVFLAFKEALNNAALHSQATQVQVRIETVAGELIIRVADNGRGFDIQPDSDSRAGNGLNNIKRRLAQIGGRAEFQSAADKGTTVTFRMPLKQS